jgi:hypothetical protein
VPARALKLRYLCLSLGQDPGWYGFGNPRRRTRTRPTQAGRRSLGYLGKAILALVVGTVVVACGRGTAPPPPDRTIRADTIGIVERSVPLGCSDRTVTVGGQAVDVFQGELNPSPGCPSHTATPFLFGGFGDLEDTRQGFQTLLFVGSLNGEEWVATASAAPHDDCYAVYLHQNEWAYLEDRTIRLTSGLVLELADNFEAPSIPESLGTPFPLRSGDLMCLDRQGKVVRVSLFFDH